MSPSELMNKSLNEQDIMNKPSASSKSLKDSRVKDYQHNNVKKLYKGEMDLIKEGFNNI